MPSPFEISIRQLLHQLTQLRHIPRELGRLRSRSSHLIQLRSSRDPARRPRDRNAERVPLEKRSSPPRRVLADRHLLQRDAGIVGEMADHLGRAHAAPAARGVDAECLEPAKNVRPVVRLRQCPHRRDTISLVVMLRGSSMGHRAGADRYRGGGAGRPVAARCFAPAVPQMESEAWDGTGAATWTPAVTTVSRPESSPAHEEER